MQALVHNKLISILVVAYMINFLFMPGNQLVLPSYFVWQSISSKHYQSTRFFFFFNLFRSFSTGSASSGHFAKALHVDEF